MHLCNEFDKFNNTGARMFNSIYHMTLTLIKITFLVRKREDLSIFNATL